MVWSRSAVNDNHFIVNWSMTWIPTHHHKDKYKKILLHHLHAALPLTDDSHIWKVRKKSRGNPLNELNPSLLIVTGLRMSRCMPPTTHHPDRLKCLPAPGCRTRPWPRLWDFLSQSTHTPHWKIFAVFIWKYLFWGRIFFLCYPGQTLFINSSSPGSGI